MSWSCRYYNKEAGVECYDEGDGTVRVIADQVNLTPEQAQAFGRALIDAAKSAKQRYPPMN
jgi:hypothetical protein